MHSASYESFERFVALNELLSRRGLLEVPGASLLAVAGDG